MTFKTSSKRCAEIDAASKAEEHLMSGITNPGLHDCLCGRGGHATNHPGNVQFRMLVNKYKDYYMGLSRYGKLQVAAEVVKIWRSQTPAGRFLAMTDPSDRENTAWHDIGDKEAIKKTSQCLRERIPPHQKARTLEMVTKKKGKSTDASKHKTVQESKSKTSNDQQSSSGPDAKRGSLLSRQSGWSETSMHEDFEPRPIMETAVVSLTNTPATPHQKTTKNISVVGMPALESLDTNRSSDASSLPIPRASNSQTREISWAQNVGSMTVEDIDMMAEALIYDDDTPSSGESKPRNFSQQETINRTSGTEDVDGSLIPSAANLTRDVFDDDVYKPLISSATKTFGGYPIADNVPSYPHEGATSTSLNQTLGSHLQNMFYL